MSVIHVILSGVVLSLLVEIHFLKRQRAREYFSGYRSGSEVNRATVYTWRESVFLLPLDETLIIRLDNQLSKNTISKEASKLKQTTTKAFKTMYSEETDSVIVYRYS